MSEPRRITGGDDLRATLLRSAKGDRVPSGAKERAIASAVARAATLPEASPITTALKAWLPKLFGLLLATAACASLYSFVQSPQPRAAVTRQRTAHAPLTIAEAPPAPPATVSAPPPSASTLKASAPPAPPKSRLAEEVRQLERVRVALVEGDTERALRELAAYERAFPSAQLAHDAKLLEIQAREQSAQRRANDLPDAASRSAPQ